MMQTAVRILVLLVIHNAQSLAALFELHFLDIHMHQVLCAPTLIRTSLE